MAWWSRIKDKKKPPPKRSVPRGLFQRCEECGQTIQTDKVKEALWCCPRCGFHFILPTDERIKLIVDAGTFVEEDTRIQPEDRLQFRDSKRYGDRLRAAQKQVGTADALREGMARV